MISLVTGGAGFIGSHVADYCLKLGHHVVVLDDLSGGERHNVPEKTEFVNGSITDQSVVASVFERWKFDYVYHLAAYAAEGLSPFIRRFNYTNNLIGSVNLINESIKHNVRCFVFTSSIAVYGAGQVPMDEDQNPSPEDPYGISKLAVELDLKNAHEFFDLGYVIFRPHNVYGERQNIADRYRNVIGIFMNQLMRGEPMTIFGDGSQTRAFTHIDSVASVIARSVHEPRALNQIFNVGSDQPKKVLELARVVAQAFNLEPRIDFLPARREVLHAFSSQEKIRRVFGAQPEISLEEGIAQMARWALKVGAQPTRPFADVEVWKGMPPSWTTFTNTR